jgi:GT2 family glycosyltransferase
MSKPIAPMAVAIAACDRPGPLIRCINALLEGEVLPGQIIVVDQSRDSAVENALVGYPCESVSLRYLRQPRLGLAASRNTALAEAEHPLISFTDDDCVPHQRWLAMLNQSLSNADGPVAATGRVLPLGDELPGTFAVSSRVGTVPRTFRGKFTPWMVGTGANFAIRREWLSKIGGFDERLGAGSAGMAGEDAELLYRLLVSGAAICYVPEAIIYHERQGMAQRLASRRSYGHGIGALCALWVRRGDRFAAKMLLGWVRVQFRGILRAGLDRNWLMMRQRFLALQGCALGFAYGMKTAEGAIQPEAQRVP